MFLNFNEMLYLYEEDSGGNTGTETETEVEVKTENTETETVTEESEVVEAEPKKTKITKKKVEKKPDVDAEALKAENQQLKLDNKLQKLCNDNNLDSTMVKELIPEFENMSEDGIEKFITKLVEVTPKLTTMKKAQPTPRILPDSQVENKTVRDKQLHQKYFGNRGGL